MAHRCKKVKGIGLLKSIKHRLFIAGIAAVLSPVLVQLAFKMDSLHPMLVASWTAGEFLAYIGSLLGAAATIAAVILTIEKSDEDSREQYRLSALPCVAMQDLHRINRKSLFDFVTGEDAAVSEKDAAKKGPYDEVKIDKEYAIYSADGFSYRCELADEQHKKIEWGLLPVEDSNGVIFGVANTSAYVPLVFSSIGNGPAVNCCISVVKADTIENVEFRGLTSCSNKQMAVGTERYLGIYFDDCTISDCFG